jgi:hypothetical protein
MANWASVKRSLTVGQRVVIVTVLAAVAIVIGVDVVERGYADVAPTVSAPRSIAGSLTPDELAVIAARGAAHDRVVAFACEPTGGRSRPH